jgi:hypothetical protein
MTCTRGTFYRLDWEVVVESVTLGEHHRPQSRTVSSHAHWCVTALMLGDI